MTMARFQTLSASSNAMISAAQCRSARALLGWSIAKLASAASVSETAIDDFETERRAGGAAVARPIRRAFEPVGVVFLSGEDVSLCSSAPLELGGDSEHKRGQTRRRKLQECHRREGPGGERAVDPGARASSPLPRPLPALSR
jgi:transcriptional regulator with XRE-family HTH domain